MQVGGIGKYLTMVNCHPFSSAGFSNVTILSLSCGIQEKTRLEKVLKLCMICDTSVSLVAIVSFNSD